MKRKTDRHIKDFGGDGKVIILLHGFLASSKYWLRMQPYLSKAGYHVIAIDLLGFGDAPKPKYANYDYKDHVEYINAIIAHQNITEPFTLVGHSMGGLIAARYSNVHPDKVSSLILLHPPLYANPEEARLTLRNTNALYRFLLDSWYRRIGWVIIKTIARRHIGRHNLTAREQSLVNVIEAAELFDDLRHISKKTLLIIGLKDGAIYEENLTLNALNRLITVLKENVAHHSPIREPELIQQRIITFLD
jgi:pimeloyl-ACP methyl ester carboxylesterase